MRQEEFSKSWIFAMRGMKRSGRLSVLAMPITVSLNPFLNGHSQRVIQHLRMQTGWFQFLYIERPKMNALLW